jgi:hypothetical protein
VHYVRSTEGSTNCITLMTVATTIPMVLLSKGMGAQVAHEGMDEPTRTVQTQEITNGQIMLSLFARKSKKPSASMTATQTTVLEATGRIAQGN